MFEFLYFFYNFSFLNLMYLLFGYIHNNLRSIFVIQSEARTHTYLY